MTQGTGGMQSVLSTLRILEEVSTRQPIGVSELARATGIPKSSVQRCLLTLQQAGWLRVIDHDNSRWGVTMKALRLGLRAAGGQNLRELVPPVLRRLGHRINETIHFSVRDESSLLIVLRYDSTRSVRSFVEIGTRAPLHATTSGLAVLAQLPDDEVDRLLGLELQRYNERTPADPKRIHREVQRARQRGYAANPKSWWREDVGAIGVAVLGASGAPIGALAISIPSLRYDTAREPELGVLALTAAAEITAALAAA